MPEPLSLDLRERIVAAYERGDLTRDQVAELFQVGRASVNRLVRRSRESGTVEPSPHGGGKPRKLTARGEKALRALVGEHPDATIPEFVRLQLMPIGQDRLVFIDGSRTKAPLHFLQNNDGLQVRSRMRCDHIHHDLPKVTVHESSSRVLREALPDVHSSDGAALV